MEVKKDFNLKNLNWFKSGGKAKYFSLINSIKDLEEISKFNEKIFILGAGSNILIPDIGINGFVIKLSDNFKFINHKTKDQILEVGASTLNASIAKYCSENGISGLEFLAGIPGTAGAGVYMNAGAYKKEYKDIVTKIIGFNMQKNILEEISNQDLEFNYRFSKLHILNDFIVLKVYIKYETNSDNWIIKKRIEEIMAQREASQPIKEKTCGSTFKNPEGKSSWKIIESLGFRGYAHGGAKVSEKHCNFIVNFNNAKSSDIFELGEIIRQAAFDKLSIDLKWEIRLIEFSPKIFRIS